MGESVIRWTHEIKQRVGGRSTDVGRTQAAVGQELRVQVGSKRQLLVLLLSLLLLVLLVRMRSPILEPARGAESAILRCQYITKPTRCWWLDRFRNYAGEEVP